MQKHWLSLRARFDGRVFEREVEKLLASVLKAQVLEDVSVREGHGYAPVMAEVQGAAEHERIWENEGSLENHGDVVVVYATGFKEDPFEGDVAKISVMVRTLMKDGEEGLKRHDERCALVRGFFSTAQLEGLTQEGEGSSTARELIDEQAQAMELEHVRVGVIGGEDVREFDRHAWVFSRFLEVRGRLKVGVEDGE